MAEHVVEDGADLADLGAGRRAVANSLLRQVLLGAVCSLGSEAFGWFLLWWQHQ
ncbi:hypothetical protein [Streptomyces melanogenes]|uniref:Uncharacterized protein n=1 Tax=Streptomyces melanogenes TaxID=67326 RepID=A0ABZ1XWV2_9ACTN|nr:hypothetical protein [Streptomyces melanogenes]